MMGIEPMTSSLPRKRSTPELHRLKNRAGNEVRTRDLQLGRLTLYRLSYSRFFVGGGGFEPPKAKPTDLQSAPFDRSGIPPDHTHNVYLQASRWRDSNPRPADYKSAALAN